MRAHDDHPVLDAATVRWPRVTACYTDERVSLLFYSGLDQARCMPDSPRGATDRGRFQVPAAYWHVQDLTMLRAGPLATFSNCMLSCLACQ